jgi:soluble lytic murein transglycosylase-like protein
VIRAWGIALALACTSLSAEGIPLAYRKVAAEYAIPVSTLYAIALTESRMLIGKRVRRPWPWTLNVAGEGYRYGSRHAAHRALVRYLRSGERGIDIGLMQVHWRYHSGKLGDSWRALDPYRNLRVGAVILRDCYRELGDWSKASGCYHSRTAWRAARYATTVTENAKGLL